MVTVRGPVPLKFVFVPLVPAGEQYEGMGDKMKLHNQNGSEPKPNRESPNYHKYESVSEQGYLIYVIGSYAQLFEVYSNFRGSSWFNHSGRHL